ncbi:hypothetical protein [Stenotrophomonas chelatiphaga]|uniref:hypothetical protein n=1 Tax=Stenotrophomonas chelatiphaga TaxID=517011 RepID=UPI0028A26E2F|nr:hypothetical protein [Stenotrophomonas chelatiphaga]
MPGLSMTTNLLPPVAPGGAVRITASESGQASPCPAAGPSSIGNRQMPVSARTIATQTEPTGCDNQARALRAMQAVRTAYRAGDKSSNKRPSQANDVDGTRYRRSIRAGYKLTYLRNLTAANFAHFRVPQTSLRIAAANCGELAAAAARQVQAEGGKAEIWALHDPQAKPVSRHPHAFTVVGTPASAESVDFAGWDDVWIVDPWANVVCPAPAFPAQLAAKLDKWAGQGKHLRDDATGRWEPADEPGFLALVREGRKVSCGEDFTLRRVTYDVMHTPRYPARLKACWTAAAAVPPVPPPAGDGAPCSGIGVAV